MPGPVQPPEREQLDRWLTSRGETLLALSERTPVLLVFLRHAGCTFCREAMADLARQRKRIEEAGVHIVLVHMSSRERFRKFAERYHVEDLDHITNPHRELYSAFGLKRGSLRQLFGWEVWKRGIQAGVLDGHGIGAVEGDSSQLPGAFLISKGAVIRSHRHYLASDRPNYFVFCALPFLGEHDETGDVQSA
ncbi:MAG: peroxiredoxin-like family protein [Acidobacteriota bacterium]